MTSAPRGPAPLLLRRVSPARHSARPTSANKRYLRTRPGPEDRQIHAEHANSSQIRLVQFPPTPLFSCNFNMLANANHSTRAYPPPFGSD